MSLYTSFIALALPATCSIVQAAIPQDIDQAFAQYIALSDKLLPILIKAQDKDSADAAASELYAVLPLVYDARSAVSKIDQLSPEVSTEVVMKYEKPMRQKWGAVYSHIFRLQKSRCYDSLALFKQFQTLCALLDQ